MLQGKHCEIHNSNQVTILPSFKHMSQEKKWEMMGVLFFRLCILHKICGDFLFACRRFWMMTGWYFIDTEYLSKDYGSC